MYKFTLILTLLFMFQVFLFAVGVKQLIEGKIIVGIFNTVINLTFGLINIRTIYNELN